MNGSDGARAGRREWIGLAVLTLPAMLISMDLTVLHLAVPSLSAELKPGQVDQDSLPPYEILDPVLEAYVEDDRTFAEIVAMGFEEATVRRVMRMVDQNEYKRRQAAPGVKITPRAFGRDRRFPLASRWRG